MSVLLIVTCVNLGSSHSANSAVFNILEEDLATGASLMVPCPWSRDAANRKKPVGIDVGVQLTLNAECESYRWGPITQSPSLLDGNGGFPKTLSDLWDHADPHEVRRECLSQIERASLWGLNISHLGSHLEALFPRPEYFDIYLELANELGLPMRLPENKQLARSVHPTESNGFSEPEYGFPLYELTKNAGVKTADQVISLSGNSEIPDIISVLNSALESGDNISDNYIVEILCSPLNDTPEARAICPTTYQEGFGVKQKLEELKREIASLTNSGQIELTSWSRLDSRN